MIDLHLHVLPGIDDGADDLATAVAMCRMAAEDGCEALILTPHQRTPTWENTDRPLLDRLRGEVERELAATAAGSGPLLHLHPGGEIRIDGLLLDELETLPGSGLMPLADSRYLLLEFDRWALTVDPVELTHELLVAGWVPIYAHPEMIPYLAEDLPLMEHLASMGALFQVTGGSLTGEYGRELRQVTARMVDEGLIHFVASDAHGTGHRPPGLSAARRELESRWDARRAWELTTGNPRAVVADRPLPAAADTGLHAVGPASGPFPIPLTADEP